jgi:hypothetical protein
MHFEKRISSNFLPMWYCSSGSSQLRPLACRDQKNEKLSAKIAKTVKMKVSLQGRLHPHADRKCCITFSLIYKKAVVVCAQDSTHTSFAPTLTPTNTRLFILLWLVTTRNRCNRLYPYPFFSLCWGFSSTIANKWDYYGGGLTRISVFWGFYLD